MSKILTLISFLTLNTVLFSQTIMQNFNVTDIYGQQHRLYEDYLDQKKVVVIKLFFTSCPPCNANAPAYQQKYVQWGSGNNGVEFFNVTTLSSDNFTQVLGYVYNHGSTSKSISSEGGAQTISNLFKNGTYGPYFGTPSFAVIAPDKSIEYSVPFSGLDLAITRAKIKTSIPPVTVNFTAALPTIAKTGNFVTFYLTSNQNPNTKYELPIASDGSITFDYPSANFPSLPEPIITMESNAPAYLPGVSVADISMIRRHILGIELFTDPNHFVAADANGDGKVSVADISAIRLVILGVENSFPNNRPSFVSIPEKVIINTGSPTQMLNMQVVKVGDLE